MRTCKTCGAPMIVNCANVNCSVGKEIYRERESIRKTERNFDSSRNSTTKVSRKRTSNRNKRPDISLPIPNDVNGAEFVANPKKSLLSFLGYSRRENQNDLMRQDSLDFIIQAGPFIPSERNKKYLESFGPRNSDKRIKRIINILERQVGAQYWVKKNPLKHAKKLPALNKAEKDIKWLKEKLQ